MDITLVIQAALLLSFAFGILLVLATLRAQRSQGEVWWPVLLGTAERSLPKADRLAIIERLRVIEDSWREPILLCALEQERDADVRAAAKSALEREDIIR